MRRLALALVASLATGPGAFAHGSGGAAGPGLSIPALTHGQMPVVADHRSAIIALADRQIRTDPGFRRLLNHARLQHTYCLWGLAPGGITDEASPFNICSHAALAAAAALLDHMQTMPAAAADAGRLHHALDRDMMAAGTASELCTHSATLFSTGAIVTPDWWAVPSHPPTLAAATAVIALGGAVQLALLRRRPTGARGTDE